MVTSRSSRPASQWIVGVRVFSGRPDPTWEPNPGVVAALLATWEQLEPAHGVPPAPPPLGYGGSFLRDPDGREWSAYAGMVTLRDDSRSVWRGDPDRQFERALLASAPPGLLPTDLGPGAPLVRAK